MEMVSRKEAKVISEKYVYRTEDKEKWKEEYFKHAKTMKDDGFKITNEKFFIGAKNAKCHMVTYVKYTSL
ncbi:hypothetical protein [Priestia megaterium]|uniref:hypothetical protein n=1 Tax=Priestia megaterium TaxID=1404 RepID=UPI0028776A50|nr:hypothetical protein [Priestia megaterium]